MKEKFEIKLNGVHYDGMEIYEDEELTFTDEFGERIYETKDDLKQVEKALPGKEDQEITIEIDGKVYFSVKMKNSIKVIDPMLQSLGRLLSFIRRFILTGCSGDGEERPKEERFHIADYNREIHCSREAEYNIGDWWMVDEDKESLAKQWLKELEQ